MTLRRRRSRPISRGAPPSPITPQSLENRLPCERHRLPIPKADPEGRSLQALRHDIICCQRLHPTRRSTSRPAVSRVAANLSFLSINFLALTHSLTHRCSSRAFARRIQACQLCCRDKHLGRTGGQANVSGGRRAQHLLSASRQIRSPLAYRLLARAPCSIIPSIPMRRPEARAQLQGSLDPCANVMASS